MKALFNCSVIKNVYLRTEDESRFELEVTYTDNPNAVWKSYKSMNEYSNIAYYKQKFEEAYNTIKQALLNNDKFVEIEI